MNDLLKSMSADMCITCFHNESEESFVYRLCYSALGQWCLSTARNNTNGIIGTSKHNQTIVLNNLLEQFASIYPYLSEYFSDINNQQSSFPTSVRKCYEETGYLLTDSENRNVVANYGRTLQLGEKILFFGYPITPCEMNGLGVYTTPTDYLIDVKDFLIRDNLTCEEYYDSCYDLIDFSDRDIDISELEFFNPTSNNVPSNSWQQELVTASTIARKTELGPYYRIMRYNNTYLFANEQITQQDDSFTSYEYRRLYFALKSHYGKPLAAYVTKIDNTYAKIRLKGHLPNREYYLFLLMSWPEDNAFNKSSFIIKNELLTVAANILSNIGIETEVY